MTCDLSSTIPSGAHNSESLMNSLGGTMPNKKRKALRKQNCNSLCIYFLKNDTIYLFIYFLLFFFGQTKSERRYVTEAKL